MHRKKKQDHCTAIGTQSESMKRTFKTISGIIIIILRVYNNNVYRFLAFILYPVTLHHTIICPITFLIFILR